MTLVVEYRHEELKKYRGTQQSLAKRLPKIMQNLNYRNHWYQFTRKEAKQLRSTYV